MFALVVLCGLVSATMAQDARFLVTGYNAEAGIYGFKDGVLTEESRQDVEPNLTWLEQDPETGNLYATHEVGDYQGQDGGAISRWEIDSEGKIVMQEYVSLESPGPAHFLLDRANNMAYTANYGGGALCVLSLTAEGQLDSLVQKETYGEGCRDASHPHQIVQRGDIVWVVDLGCDAIYSYRVANGQLEKVGETSVQAGAGPRHMVLHPTKNLAFLAWELISNVEVYSVDFATGDLTLLQQLPFASEATNAGAEILVSQDGNYVYASSRRVGVVVVYKVNDDSLERIQEYFLQGTWPRSMVLLGNYLVVAHKIDSNIEVLAVDPATGQLSSTDAPLISTPANPAFIMKLQ